MIPGVIYQADQELGGPWNVLLQKIALLQKLWVKIGKIETC